MTEPSVSEAVAWIRTFVPTLAPLTGLVIVIDGRWLPGRLTVMLTAAEVTAESLASSATASSVCAPAVAPFQVKA